jgi:crotonobetainyl-CoA:carnitine CoA-transferase CaiB-like acyl-CoA transferase
MGDWGAEVVKVEGLTGDPIRWVRPPYKAESPDIPPNFEIDNHGKKSIAVDISKPEGRDVVLELLRTADVFVTSLREASLARAGLNFDVVRKLNPALVFASVSGYGLKGPGASMNAFDLTAFWSRSGLALQFFPPDAMPSGVRPGVGDHITGLTLALGIMAALVERARTGKGRVVEASLLAAGLYVGSYDIAEFMRRGAVMPSQSRASADSASFYQSQDGRWFSYYPNNPEHDWMTIFAAANRRDMIDDARFATPNGRRENARDLKLALDAGFGGAPMAAIAETFNAGGLTWSEMSTLPEVVSDPLVAATGCFIDFDDGQDGTLRVPGPPVRFPDVEPRRAGPVPTIGQHTEEILLGLGRDDNAIAALRREGVVR